MIEKGRVVLSKELPLRENISDEFKWNLHDIYETDDKWEEDFEKVINSLEDIRSLQGKLINNADQLYQGLNKLLEIEKVTTRLNAYSHMKSDQNTKNEKYQAFNNRAMGLYNQLADATSFVVPEILKLSEEKIRNFYQENENLKDFEHYFNNILRQKKHFLSADEERLIALTGEIANGPNNIFSMLNNADIEFPLMKDEKGNEIRITHGRYIDLLKSSESRVRKEAFQKLQGTYGELENTFAATLDTAVKSHIYYAKVRKYDNALQSALDDDNVPITVYDNLIATVSDNLAPLHKYMELKREFLELDELHIYDLYTPLITKIDLKYDYARAKEEVLKGTALLGDEYQNLLKNGFQNGWIDVYENRGKRSGAYSSGCYGVHPYVLLNYTEDISNLFTLAHEMGHALHSYYANKNQPYHYASYKIFVAEVASTLNENLLIDHLLNNADTKEEKLYLINYFLEGFRGTVFRQTMFAEFEKLIHARVEEGIPLTASQLKDDYYQLNKKYFGEKVILDDEIKWEWARIPHFYYNFYVYKYATGYAAATALADKIRKEGEQAKNKYIDFLKAGGSDYPIELLKSAGVDMNSPQPIKKGIDVFAKYVNKLEELK